MHHAETGWPYRVVRASRSTVLARNVGPIVANASTSARTASPAGGSSWCPGSVSHDADDEVLPDGFDRFFRDGGDLVDLQDALDLVDEPGQAEVAVGDTSDGCHGLSRGVVVAVAALDLLASWNAPAPAAAASTS